VMWFTQLRVDSSENWSALGPEDMTACTAHVCFRGQSRHDFLRFRGRYRG
jgi:hypothetical protein